MRRRAAHRDPRYPGRFFGKWFEDRILYLIDKGEFHSFRDFAQWTGYSEQCISDWRNGHTLPDSEQDWELIMQYSGRTGRKQLAKLEAMDRIDGLRDSLHMPNVEFRRIVQEIYTGK